MIGIGNSGCDIVTELAKVADYTWLVARSGMDVKRGEWGSHLSDGRVVKEIMCFPTVMQVPTCST